MKYLRLSMAVAAALTLAGCAVSNGPVRVGPTYEDAAASKFMAANRTAINTLVAGIDLAQLAGAPVLVATVVNVNDLRRAAPLGRTLSEQYASIMVANGFNVKELKLRGDVFGGELPASGGGCAPLEQIGGEKAQMRVNLRSRYAYRHRPDRAWPRLRPAQRRRRQQAAAGTALTIQPLPQQNPAPARFFYIVVSLATLSASHFTPWRVKFICARASSPLPSSIKTLPSPNLA